MAFAFEKLIVYQKVIYFAYGRKHSMLASKSSR
jgi:hypothetical protein